MMYTEKLEKQLVHEIRIMPSDLLRKWLVEFVYKADMKTLEHLHKALSVEA